MFRMTKYKGSKRAVTLVELVVTMALTAMFAATCVMLIYPVTRIYTHTNELSRAQIVADMVIDSLRAECARTYITGTGDVWIGSRGDLVLQTAETSASGPVLVIRKNRDYCETIAANYSITGDGIGSENPVGLYGEVWSADESHSTNSNGVTSRAIYRLFPTPVPISGESTRNDLSEGYVHFGYYECAAGGASPVLPSKYYDFTNPFTGAAYRDFTVTLNFRWDEDVDEDEGPSSDPTPTYVLCDVTVCMRDVPVYTRTVVLCFASPVV